MKKIVIKNQEVIDQLEALDFEVTSRLNLLSHMARTGVLPSEPAFAAYHKEYQEFFVKYETVKAEFERRYAIPLVPDGEKFNWRLDYAARELTILGIDE